MPPTASDSDDDADWVDAANYMAAHGDRWPDEAVVHLKSISITGDHAGFKRWSELIDKMIELAETPRQ